MTSREIALILRMQSAAIKSIVDTRKAIRDESYRRVESLRVRMAYSYPERLRCRSCGRDRCNCYPASFERIPNHPTRPARETDVSTWEEEITECISETTTAVS